MEDFLRGGGKGLSLWELSSGKVQTLTGHEGAGPQFAFTPNGRELIRASMDGEVCCWERATGQFLGLAREERKDDTNLRALSTDGTALALVEKGEVVCKDLVLGQVRSSRPAEDTVAGLALSARGETLAILSLRGKVTNEAIACFLKADILYEMVKRERRNSQGKVARAEPHSWQFTVVDTATGKPRATWKAGPDGFLFFNGERPLFALSSDGEWLALAMGSTVRVWATRDGSEVATLRGHQDTVTCLSFAPTGAWLASGSLDRTALVWDLAHFLPRRGR
jgi:WD40 repeat protein